MTRLAAFVCVLLSTGIASACACVDWPSDRRMAEADRVFLGRAVKSMQRDELQHFTVLLWLKGAMPGSTYAIQHSTNDDCERSFNIDELALVFEAHGKMPVCNGNVDLDDIMPSLGDYLGESSTPTSNEVLSKALAGRLGKAKKLTLYDPAAASASLVVGGTKVTFTDKHTDELGTLTATTKGDVSYVRLRRADGSSASILVGREHGKLGVLAAYERPNLR